MSSKSSNYFVLIARFSFLASMLIKCWLLPFKVGVGKKWKIKLFSLRRPTLAQLGVDQK